MTVDRQKMQVKHKDNVKVSLNCSKDQTSTVKIQTANRTGQSLLASASQLVEQHYKQQGSLIPYPLHLITEAPSPPLFTTRRCGREPQEILNQNGMYASILAMNPKPKSYARPVITVRWRLAFAMDYWQLSPNMLASIFLGIHFSGMTNLTLSANCCSWKENRRRKYNIKLTELAA